MPCAWHPAACRTCGTVHARTRFATRSSPDSSSPRRSPSGGSSRSLAITWCMKWPGDDRMTATLSRGRQRTRAIYAVERLQDQEAIRGLLSPERAYAAYALAQLDPGLFRLSEWYAASGSDGAGLIFHSRGGLGRALFVLGHPTAVEAALSVHPGPRFSFGSLRPEHRRSIEKFFVCTRPQTMLRMSVTQASFKCVDGEAVRLTGRDVGIINRLYATESGSSAYHARHVDAGVYYGGHIN